MSNRARKARGKLKPPVESTRATHKFRSLTHRGTTIDFVSSGIVVKADDPESLVEATDLEIQRLTKEEPEN